MAIGRCDCTAMVVWDLLFVRLGVDNWGWIEEGCVEVESNVDVDLVVGTVPSDLLDRLDPFDSFSVLKLLLFRLKSLKNGIAALDLRYHAIRGPLCRF